MLERQNATYLCNPALWIHGAWKRHLPMLGVPPGLARALWRKDSLSPFLIARFRLGRPPPFDRSNSLHRLLLMRAGALEEGLLRVGLLRHRAFFLGLLDGRLLRRYRQEIGAASMAFIRGNHAAQILDDARAQKIETPFRGREAARAAGYELLLSHLSPLDERHERRLRLKMPPHSAPTPLKCGWGEGEKHAETMLRAVFQEMAPAWLS